MANANPNKMTADEPKVEPKAKPKGKAKAKATEEKLPPATSFGGSIKTR